MFDEKWERQSFKDNNPASPQHSVEAIRLLVAISVIPIFIRSIRSAPLIGHPLRGLASLGGYALRSDTNRGHEKTSLRVSCEVVVITC